MLKIDYLLYFKAAAETGSFSGAEKSLYISSTSIVRAVDILEQQLGTRLFLRRPARGLTLTPDGKRLLLHANRVLSEMESLEHAFVSDSGIKGELVLGSISGLAWSLVPLLVESLSETDPELKVQLKVVATADSADVLESGEVDVLLTFFSGSLGKNCEFLELAEANAYAMLSASHRLAEEKSLSLQQIAEYPQIAFDDSILIHAYDNLFSQRGLTADIRMLTSSNVVSWSIVSVTDFITLRYIRAQHSLSPLGKEIVCIPIEDDLPVVKLGMATLKTQGHNSKINRFKEVCSGFFAAGRFDQFIVSD